MASTRASAGSVTARPAELNTYHRNPRRGDIGVISASLKAHGQYKPIVVNRGTFTGRPNEVLAGNHTLMAIRDLAEREPTDDRWTSVLVHWIDVDDDRAARIVVADNRTSELGSFDTAELSALLDSMGADLEGLGYTDLDIADLHAILEEQQPDLGGDPFAFADHAPVDRSKRDPDDDGVLRGKDIAGQALDYADQATRMIILHLPISRFVWVQTVMEKLRKDRGVESNSDLVTMLLEEITGETAPA